MKRLIALCLTAACLISLVGCAGDTNMDEKKPNNTASAYALALASYPEMAPYPNEMSISMKRPASSTAIALMWSMTHGRKTGTLNAINRRVMQMVWNRSSPVRSGSSSAIPTAQTRSTLP